MMNFHFIRSVGGFPCGFDLQHPNKVFAKAITVGFVAMTKRGIMLKTYIFSRAVKLENIT